MTDEVGNSIQQQQPQGPDQEITVHTIQEQPFIGQFSPNIHIKTDKDTMFDLITDIYEYLSFLNKNYKFDDDALNILKQQGFIKFIQSNPIEDGREKIGQDIVSNFIYNGIASLVYMNPIMLVFQIVPDIIDAIKYGMSQADQKDGQEIIDQWYRLTLSRFL